MAPPPVASQFVDDQETISLWDYLVQCGINVDAAVSAAAVPFSKTAEAAADADGDPNDLLIIPPFQLSQHHHDCTNESAGSEGRSKDLTAAQPVVGKVSSESMSGAAGYCMLPPVANKIDDPLELTIGPHHVPGINLNLLPPESLKTFERPPRTVARVRGRKDAEFGGPFFILESSEVAREYAERQREEEEKEEANNKRRRVVEGEAELDAANKRERRYRWPAKTVTNINDKIEQLKKEAARTPAQRRSFQVIEAEIDALQAKKDQIHARVSGQQGSSGAGGGRPPPPSFGN